MPVTYQAHYECVRCKHKFVVAQGSGHNNPKQCPKCQHLWVKWLDYEELKQRFGWP